MTREEIIKTVSDCILKDRQNTHGNPENNFQTIADFWNIYTGCNFTAKDVSIMMILLKIARMKSSPNYLDNYVDAAGYAVIGGSLADDNNHRVHSK